MAGDKIERLWRSQYPKATRRIVHLDETIDHFIIGAYAPPAPFLARDSQVVSIGSCFATEIAKSLGGLGVKVASSFIAEGVSSAFALTYLLRYLITGKKFPEGYLQDTSLFNRVAPDFAAHIAQAEMFVVTLGLSCVWINSATGNIALEPRKAFSDAGLLRATGEFEMRQTSVEENVAAISDVIALIRSVNPNCTIVFTLSPIPLVVAMTDDPPVAANTVSKAVLRAALHTLLAKKLPGIHYWPSYEYVNWIGTNVQIVFGTEGNDLRHIPQKLIDSITARFIKYYFKDLTPGAAAQEAAASA